MGSSRLLEASSMGSSLLRKIFTQETLQVYGLSDKGSIRPNNEDYFGYFVPDDAHMKEQWGSLFAISDGVGGSSAGEVASAEAVNVLLQEYYFGDYSDKAPDRLKSAFRHTALHIYDLGIAHATARNMKCTLSTLLLKQNRFFITHVGDSKIYLLRENGIIQLTKDHSMVGKLMRLGLITAEDARFHPNKNILLKAVGDGPLLVPDFYSGIAKSGDLFCLVTDGITEHATENELKDFLLDKGSSDTELTELVAELNRRGGHDNMTIMTVRVNKVPC